MEPGDPVLDRQKAFKGKHKISDRWDNIPYHVIDHVGKYLSVYKVQLIDETTKFRILHRNLLFPLAMRNKSDEKQQKLEEKEPELTGTKEENGTTSVQHLNNYEGPSTRSKTKRWKMHCYSRPIL